MDPEMIKNNIKEFEEKLLNLILAYQWLEVDIETLIEILIECKLEFIDPLEFLEFLTQHGIVEKNEDGYFFTSDLSEEFLFNCLS